jgi:hypothetical protein
MAGERDLGDGREDPDLGASHVVDEDGLGEVQLPSDALAFGHGHLASVEEHPERIAARSVATDENPQYVKDRHSS